MPVEIVMPRLSDTMTEGTIARWLKQPGDPVKRGEALAEIETDKALMQYESFDEGTLGEIKVGDGQTVPLGEVIALLYRVGEAVPGGATAEPAAADRSGPPAANAPAARSGQPAASASVDRSEEPAAPAPASRSEPPAAAVPAGAGGGRGVGASAPGAGQ